MSEATLFQEELDQATVQFETKLDRDVSQLLKKNKFTIAVAESLTAGLIASRLVRYAGSTSYFLGGAICYQPATKIHFCGVSPATIRNEGEVSQSVALEMAQGLKSRLQADLCISTTGVAGPATDAYPAESVGKVFIGFSLKQKDDVKFYRFEGSRDIIRQKTTTAALAGLRQWLENQTQGGL